MCSSHDPLATSNNMLLNVVTQHSYGLTPDTDLDLTGHRDMLIINRIS